MIDTPPDWVLIEAAKRSGLSSGIESIRPNYPMQFSTAFRALCDMIYRYEQPPVERKLLCAEQAIADWVQTTDDIGQEFIAIRAIDLWEEGFGK